MLKYIATLCLLMQLGFANDQLEIKVTVFEAGEPNKTVGNAVIKILNQPLNRQTGSTSGEAILFIPSAAVKEMNYILDLLVYKVGYDTIHESIRIDPIELDKGSIVREIRYPLRKKLPVANDSPPPPEPEWIEFSGRIWDTLLKKPVGCARIVLFELDNLVNQDVLTSPNSGSFVVNIPKARLAQLGYKMEIYIEKAGYDRTEKKMEFAPDEIDKKLKYVKFEIRPPTPSKLTLLIPGLHGLRRGDTTSGMLLMSGSLLLTAGWGISYYKSQNEEDAQYDAASQEAANRHFERAKNWRGAAIVFAGGIALSYIGNFWNYAVWKKNLSRQMAQNNARTKLCWAVSPGGRTFQVSVLAAF